MNFSMKISKISSDILIYVFEEAMNHITRLREYPSLVFCSGTTSDVMTELASRLEKFINARETALKIG